MANCALMRNLNTLFLLKKGPTVKLISTDNPLKVRLSNRHNGALHSILSQWSVCNECALEYLKQSVPKEHGTQLHTCDALIKEANGNTKSQISKLF